MKSINNGVKRIFFSALVSLRIVVTLILFLALNNASRAFATPIVDQSNIYPASGGIASWTVYETATDKFVLAQTFTAGLSGRLVGVNLGLTQKADEDLFINIVPTLAGLPDIAGGYLASSILTPADVDKDPFSLESVDFSISMFDITAGEMYAIVLSSSTPFNREYDWTRGSFDVYTGSDLSPLDPYTGGDGYFSNDGGLTWSALASASYDFSFQTIVEPTLVPEPGQLALLALGIFALTQCRRRI